MLNSVADLVTGVHGIGTGWSVIGQPDSDVVRNSKNYKTAQNFKGLCKLGKALKLEKTPENLNLRTAKMFEDFL